MKRWTWRTNLEALMGKLIVIETRDGIYLRGRLTGTKSVSFVFDGRDVEHITTLVLDDDPEKVADVLMLKTVVVEPD